MGDLNWVGSGLAAFGGRGAIAAVAKAIDPIDAQQMDLPSRLTAAAKSAAACFAISCCMFGASALATINRNRDAPLPVTIAFSLPSTCQVSFANQAYSLPEDEERMAVALRQLRRHWRVLLISGGEETPFRCVGQAIYLLQRGGFDKVWLGTRSAEN